MTKDEFLSYKKGDFLYIDTTYKVTSRTPEYIFIENVYNNNINKFVLYHTNGTEPSDIKKIEVGDLFITTHANYVVSKINDDIYLKPLSVLGYEFIMNSTFKFNKFTKMTVSNIVSCSHEWKDYVGFTQVYKYCAKCNIKDKE